MNARSPVRPNGKRIITRNSFEIYEDQKESLRKLSLQEKMEGKLGSMSQMVRDAIDLTSKKNHPRNNRSTYTPVHARSVERPNVRPNVGTGGRANGTIQRLKSVI